MTAAHVTARRLVIAAAGACYLGVFAAFLLVERPGLGLGHFFYVPVCLLALETNVLVGAGGGLLAAGLYMLAALASQHAESLPLTVATEIRAVTFTIVGGLVGFVAHRNRHLVARLRRYAQTDFVTDVGNARAFDEELMRRCASRERFSLVLVDVNELRRVNEVHGHMAGDAALRHVAAIVRGCVGRDDHVSRVGGDEFAVLTSLSADEVARLTERLNTALGPGELSVTTASTCSPDDGQAAGDLFRKADDRLFAAKLVRANRALVSV